jgi:hypothetical protein
MNSARESLTIGVEEGSELMRLPCRSRLTALRADLATPKLSRLNERRLTYKG